MSPALNVRAIGANVARPLLEHLHPVLPNATENPEFRHAKHRNSTELSKHTWTLKDNNIEHFISWRILSSRSSYNSSSKRCNLCLKGKFPIICRPKLSTLNKRNELVSSCRHRNKAFLHNLTVNFALHKLDQLNYVNYIVYKRW